MPYIVDPNGLLFRAAGFLTGADGVLRRIGASASQSAPPVVVVPPAPAPVAFQIAPPVFPTAELVAWSSTPVAQANTSAQPLGAYGVNVLAQMPEVR